MKKSLVVSGLALVLAVALYAALRPVQAGAPLLRPRLEPETFSINTGDGLSLTLSTDGQVTSVQIDGNELVTAPAPALFLRDLSRAGQVITPNLIANPGFESGLAGWSEMINNGLGVSVVLSPTHSGSHALAFTSNLTGTTHFAAYVSDPVSVIPDHRYRVSAWFHSNIGYVTDPVGTPTLLQKGLWRHPQYTNGLYVQWLDTAGQPSGEPQLAVALHANADRWRLIRRELTAPPEAVQARVAIAARLENQTLCVDDVAFVPSPEPDTPVTGSVTPCPGEENCLLQTATLSSGLVFTLTYTAHASHIAIHGTVADTTGQDRALDVNWAMPLAATSSMPARTGVEAIWTWWDDTHTSRPITEVCLYANEISAIYDGWLPMSLYPYAGIAKADNGLALSLPLDQPQLALLAYDGATGRYGATYHLGTSPRAVKAGPRATFDLVLYRFDQTWGFRSVIARHHALQLNAYASSRSLYGYEGRSQGWYFTANGVQQVLAEDKANIYSAQYTAAELTLQVIPSDQPRPTLDQALAVVTGTLSSPHPWDVALGRAITQSAAVDPNGDWSLKHIGVFSWDPDHWQSTWAANADPELKDGLATFLLNWRITPSFTATTEAGAHLDGVQIDNFMANPTFDLRPEALAVSDWPLSYTPHTYQPAVHTGYTLREYLAFLRDYLDTNWGNDRAITINFWGLGHPNYLAPYIDGFGSEGNLKGNGEGPNWNPEVLDYRRAIAYQRPYLYTNQTTGLTAAEAYTSCQLALLYGVCPGHGPNGFGWDPTADQIISDTAQLVARYWSSGWEPVTYAWADDPAVWVERFGPRAEDGRLFFTVHNTLTESVPFTLTVDVAALGIAEAATLQITELTSGDTVPFAVQSGLVRIQGDLAPLETVIFRLATWRIYLPIILKE